MRLRLPDGFAQAISPGCWGWWLAFVVAAGSLAVIGIRPNRLVPTSPRAGVLLTPGVDSRVLERLLDSLGQAWVARTPGVGVREFHRYPIVRDLDQFQTLYPDLVSVVALGWGIEPEVLDRIPPPVALIPRLASPPAGFPAIGALQSTVFGEPVRFSGSVKGAQANDQVYLTDAVGPVDSAPLADDGSFSLTWRPRASGPSRLVLSFGPGPGRGESIMVDVVEPSPGRAMILDASPSFETSALRRWLAQGGSAIVHRTTLSRGLTREERVNDPATASPSTRLTRAWLRQFELVVLDERTLGALERTERRDLARAITEDGLGLLIVAAGEAGTMQALDASERAFFVDAEWDRFPELEQRNVRPQWGDVGPSTPSLATAPAVLEERFGQATVIRDGTGGVLAQVRGVGAGRVGVVISLETNRWQRYGDEDAYAGFWTTLLSKIMRDPPETERWQVSGAAIPRVHEQLLLEGWPEEDLDLVTVGTPAGRVDTLFLAPGDWGARPMRGLYWPRESGWHRIATPHGDRLFYVYPEDAWRAVAATRRRDATRRAAIMAVPPGQADTVLVPQPMRLGWVFVLFLMSAAVLWLGEDFRGAATRSAPGA